MPPRTFFPCPVSGILLLSLELCSVVASAARSAGLQSYAAAALERVPVILPLPLVVIVFPGPAVALPLTVPPETLMLPLEMMCPELPMTEPEPCESMTPSDMVKSPHEERAWETKGVVIVKASSARDARGSVAAATAASTRMAIRLFI